MMNEVAGGVKRRALGRGLGALIREGLVRAVRRELEVVIEPASTHQTA